MNERIKHFIYPENSDLNDEENLRIYNRSSHDNIIHQIIFQEADKFAKRVIKDLFNTNREVLFDENMLNIIAEENLIKILIEEESKNKVGDASLLGSLAIFVAKVKKSIKICLVRTLMFYKMHVPQKLSAKPLLANPEIIYRGFNFVKPATLLPNYQNKLYLIKQIGETETGEVQLYLINPYFFAFKLSFDLFIIIAYFQDTIDGLKEGLVAILEDKYGREFVNIFNYVSYVSYEAAKIGNMNGDENDETLIKKVQEISGIVNEKIHYEFVYHSSVLSANLIKEVITKFILEENDNT